VDERALPRPLGEALEPLFSALEEAAEGDADTLAAYKGNSVYMWRLQRQMPGHSYEQFVLPCVRGARCVPCAVLPRARRALQAQLCWLPAAQRPELSPAAAASASAPQMLPGTREALAGAEALVERAKRMFPAQVRPAAGGGWCGGVGVRALPRRCGARAAWAAALPAWSPTAWAGPGRPEARADSSAAVPLHPQVPDAVRAADEAAARRAAEQKEAADAAAAEAKAAAAAAGAGGDGAAAGEVKQEQGAAGASEGAGTEGGEASGAAGTDAGPSAGQQAASSLQPSQAAAEGDEEMGEAEQEGGEEGAAEEGEEGADS
jgi:hypothetical protein